MISIVVPFLNESESIRELHERILGVMKKQGEPFEIIFVDDGSSDGTFEVIKTLSPIRGFRFKRNAGQTAAFGCGISHAKGDIIVTMDGDLENAPEDIPTLILKLREGYDVVSGWRKKRWSDQFATRRIPSVIANKLISAVTRVRVNDHGCNLRAYRREVFHGVMFRGEMHRMLTAYLGMRGARVTQVPVSYMPRKYGKSKYGLSRIFRVLLDVLSLHFFREYASRPMHFFGYVGFFSFLFGAIAFGGALYARIFEGVHFNRTPLPELVALFVIVGVQFVLMGLLAELLVRSRTGSDIRYDSEEDIEHHEREI